MSESSPIFQIHERGGFEGGFKEKDPLGTLVKTATGIAFVPASRLQLPEIRWPVKRTADPYRPLELDLPDEIEMPYMPRTWVQGSFALTALPPGEKRDERHTNAEFEKAGFVATLSIHFEPIRIPHYHGRASMSNRDHGGFLCAAFTAEEWAALKDWIEKRLPAKH